MTDRTFDPYLDSIIRAFVAACWSNRNATPGDLAPLPLPPFGSKDWEPYEGAALAAVVANTDAGAPRAAHFAFHRYDPPCDFDAVEGMDRESRKCAASAARDAAIEYRRAAGLLPDPPPDPDEGVVDILLEPLAYPPTGYRSETQKRPLLQSPKAGRE